MEPVLLRPDDHRDLRARYPKKLAFVEDQSTIAFQSGEPTLAGLDFYQNCLEPEERYFLIGLSIGGVKVSHNVYRKDSQGKDTYLRMLDATQRLKRPKIQCGTDESICTHDQMVTLREKDNVISADCL